MTVHLRPGPELEKVRREVTEWERFSVAGRADHGGERGDLRGPAGVAGQRRDAAPPTRRGKKGALRGARGREAAAEIARLAGAWPPVAGLRGRASRRRRWRSGPGCCSLGGGVLEEPLTADPGYRGPRVGCGHRASRRSSSSYRDKAVDTVLGPGHPEPGLVPLRRLRARPGARGMSSWASPETSMSPGLARDERPGRRRRCRSRRRPGCWSDLAGVTPDRQAGRAGTPRPAAPRRPPRSRGRAAADRHPHAGPAAARSPLPDKLYVAIDGTGVPDDRDSETAGRDGKGEDGQRPHPRGQTGRASSPRQGWTRTATRSATRTPPATSPPSSPPPRSAS